MNVLVVGATGGSGRAAVQQLLARGHHVTAFTRSGQLATEHARLSVLRGDATNQRDVERAVQGKDAVVVTLGITENPFRVRFFGAAHTPTSVRSEGTRHVIAAMKKYGVRRLVVQTTYGVGETRDKLGFVDSMFFKLLLKPQIVDSELQNAEVTASELDWVLAQPVHLTDDAADPAPFLSLEGETGAMKVSRASVGRFLADAAQDARYVRKSVAISGPMQV
ncbi:MAG TPA: NAD(P)H-binding protein [Polyangiales bacterium]|nr:NAD(P)H-binding protein [Polyangiales bacterium]